MRTRTKATDVAEETTGGNSIVASAARLSGSTDYSQTAKLASQEWQKAAWDFYHTVGEYRFACDWVGSMLSKSILYAVQEKPGQGPERVDTGSAAELVASLGGDEAGRSEMLHAIGVHFTVAGECYLVGTEDEWGDDEWLIYAAHTITKRGGKWYANSRQLRSFDGSDPLVIRMWVPNPVDPQAAHSPSRAVLPILAEIDGLTKHVSAQIDSRLAGAGILLVPSEMSFPAKPVQNLDGTVTQVTGSSASALVQMLQDVMATAIQNRSDASALVPIVLQAPGEAIQHVKHLTFWSGLDEHTIELRDEAIRRLALGMDMPPEVLLGVADTNHWAAWAADESAIKAHTEPLLRIVTRALTTGFLRPMLRDDGEKEPRLFGIAADTSQMRLRPNRSKEALELNDRGMLKDVATLRETGFEAADLMDDKERATWLTRKIASGSATPEMVAWAARELGVKMPEEVITQGRPNEARPDPSLLDHPVRELPEEQEATARLEAAAEQMVFRALERAGNRMRTSMGRKIEGVSAMDTYLYVDVDKSKVEHYLEDAFGTVERFTSGPKGLSPARLRECLETYVRMLLTQRQPHSPSTMATYLTLARVEAA